MKFGSDRKWMMILTFGVPVLGAIFAVLGSTAYSKLNQARVTNAQAQLNQITRELVRYQSDCGVYPSTEQGLKALTERPVAPPICSGWNGPYGRVVGRDPWSKEFVYAGDGRAFALSSYGADTRKGGEGYDKDLVFGGY